MTERGRTATYRRIGDPDATEEGGGPSTAGLRRISEAPDEPVPSVDEDVDAPTDEWSVPHPDDLSSPEDEAPSPRRRVRTEAPSSPPAERARGGRLRAAVAALAVVAVGLAAAVVVLAVMVHHRNTTDSLRSSALATAQSDGVLLSSYDYRNLTGPGSDWSRVVAASTPTFRRNFLSTSADLGKLLTQYSATATGKVLTAGLVSITSSRAVVLLFIDQTVDNTAQKGQSSTQPLRSQLTLAREGGRWLIDDLQVPK